MARIDFGGGLEWRSWQPGGEYVKLLNIKNIGTTAHNVKYVLPTSKVFSMQFPESFVLAPGIVCSLAVKFRPINKERYEDTVEFIIDNDARERVSLRAVLPSVKLVIPPVVDFGYCAVRETLTRTLTVENCGEVSTDFVWNAPVGFTISPTTGSLRPGSSTTITAVFTPTDASVCVGTAVCLISGEPSLSYGCELRGVGKYPFVSATPSEVDFGEIATGKSCEESVVLTNPSLVSTRFKIQLVAAADASVAFTPFKFTPSEGVIRAGQSITVKISFTPIVNGASVADEFSLTTLGGTPVRIRLSGGGVGPTVTATSKSLNFGDVALGETAMRKLELVNHNGVPASYQLLFEPDGPFTCDTDNAMGAIPPNGTKKFTVTFCPTAPINYYWRVTCLVENQDPFYVDFLGSCFTDTVRPASFSQQQVDNFQKWSRSGLSKYPPDLLADAIAKAPAMSYQLVTGEDILKSIFADASDVNQPISWSESEVDFGACMAGQVAVKHLTISNRTLGKVTCTWLPPNSSNEEGSGAFRVEPSSFDINPGESFDVQLMFAPHLDERFFGRLLEFLVAYKVMRTFRLVTDDTFCPPWRITVRALGHTFQRGAEQFVPQVAYSLPGGRAGLAETGRLVFPACRVGEERFQTVRLTNTGETPLKFSHSEDPLGVFSVRPRSGVLQGKQSQLLVVRFAPREAKRYQLSLACMLNNSAVNMVMLMLGGTSVAPRITLPSDVLVFKPTGVRTTSTRDIQIANNGGLPIRFKWSISEKHQAYVSVQPVSGVLLPNTTQTAVWSFSPAAVRDYSMKAVLESFSASSNSTEPEAKTTLSLLGEGSQPLVVADPVVADFEQVAINREAKKDITFFNSGTAEVRCRLHFQLSLDGNRTTTERPSTGLSDLGRKPELELSPSTFTIAGRTHVVVTAFFRPMHRANYTYMVTCVQDDANAPELASCKITGAGTLPSLKIADAFSMRCPKAQLWSRLSLDALNNELQRDLTVAEVSFLSAKGLDGPKLIGHLPSFLVDLGSTPLGSVPTVTTLLFQNVGVTQLDWALRLPQDLEADVPAWTEMGKMTEQDLTADLALRSKLFSVEPRVGSLAPGAVAVVKIFCINDLVEGTHEINCILAVEKGKQLSLSLRSNVIPRNTPWLDLPCPHPYRQPYHRFAPVFIGEESATRQRFQFSNPSNVTAEYEFDLSGVSKLNAVSHHFDVLTCGTTKGTLAPGATADIVWLFRPLAPKDYSVDVAVRFKAVGSTGPPVVSTVTLCGPGVDPRTTTMTNAVPVNPSEYGFTTAPVCQAKELLQDAQPAMLSIENMFFGHVPMYSVSRRLVAVMNLVADDLSFEWQLKGGADHGVLDIQPRIGIVKPGQECICKITFYPGILPENYDFDVCCLIYNETERARKRRVVEENARLAADQAENNTMIAVDGGRKNARRDGRDAGLAAEPATKKHTSVIPGQATKLLRFAPDDASATTELQTPANSITSFGGVRAGRLGSLPRGEAAAARRETTEPPAWKLFLHVMGRSYPVEQYKVTFPDFNSFFVSRLGTNKAWRREVTVQRKAPPKPTVSLISQIQATPSSVENKEVVTEVLSYLLQDIVFDPDISLTIEKVERAAVPYYSQIITPPRDRPPVPAAAITTSQGPEQLGAPPLPSLTLSPIVPGRPGGPAAGAGPADESKVDASLPDVPPLPAETIGKSEEEVGRDFRVATLREFQELTELLLESTIFNLMEEVSAGELDLTKKAIKVSRNVVITR